MGAKRAAISANWRKSLLVKDADIERSFVKSGAVYEKDTWRLNVLFRMERIV
jgi:hypothetical protein